MAQLVSHRGLAGSRFVFGAMQFGDGADAKASREMFDACRAAGITHFDTAWIYTDGASERLLGALAKAERDDLIIASKVGCTGGAGAANMQAQFDQSRQRLGMDVVDLLYLHRFDPDTDLRETMGCFAQLREAGRIRYVGVSNFAAWQVMKAQAIAATFGLSIDVVQPMYNLVKRQAEVELLPMCADQDMTVAAYSPLGGGLLTGKYASGGTGRLDRDARYGARYRLGWMHDAARALSAIASELGTEAATLAVAWVARHPTAPHPIVSARSAAQLNPSLDALSFDMGEALYARISALSPAPPPATDRLEEQT